MILKKLDKSGKPFNPPSDANCTWYITPMSGAVRASGADPTTLIFNCVTAIDGCVDESGAVVAKDGKELIRKLGDYVGDKAMDTTLGEIILEIRRRSDLTEDDAKNSKP